MLQGIIDVCFDFQLNKKVWEQGVKGVFYRFCVCIFWKCNDEEGVKEKFYSYVQVVNVMNFKGFYIVVVEE